jgi:hypothetical protein
MRVIVRSLPIALGLAITLTGCGSPPIRPRLTPCGSGSTRRRS